MFSVRRVSSILLLLAFVLGIFQNVEAQTFLGFQISTTTPPIITRSLSFGNSGTDVAAVQNFLKELGYFKYPTVTGYFGSYTWRAVANFQRDNGIEAIGIVGPKTRAKIAEFFQMPDQSSNNAIAPTSPANIPASSLQAPRHLTISADSHGVSISWDAIENAILYQINRRSIDSVYKRIASTTATSYLDKEVINENYSYTITAVNIWGERALSTEVSAEVKGWVTSRRGGGSSYTPSTTPDTTAPYRSAGAPSGTLELNTVSTLMSLSTDEIATCKYSASPGIAYDLMTIFSATVDTSHSTSITGLANGGSYLYYVKCADSQNNTNVTDYAISFSVAADVTAPSVSVTSPLDNLVVSGGSVTLTAEATDDVSVAGVQFKLDTDTAIGVEDTVSPFSLAWDSTGVSDGIHTITAVARDGTGNYATSSEISVTVDNVTPPVISLISSGTPGETEATITWTTDENADSQVEWGLTTSYTGTTTLDSSATTSHSVALTGLIQNTLYHFRVRSADSNGNLTISTDQSFTTADFAEFAGTGRIGVMAVAINTTASGNFGDGANASRLARRAGLPWYVMLRELTTEKWLAYELPTVSQSTSDGPVHLSSYGIYEPMKKLLYNNAVATDGDGGAVAYPQTSASQYVQWNLSTIATDVTRLGIIIGIAQSNCSVATVTITDNASGNPVVPNLLATAQQAVNRGQIASSALTTNGGSIDPSEYITGTSNVDVVRNNSHKYSTVPLADSLPAGSYTVRVTYEGVAGRSQIAVDRMYVAGITYGTSSLAYSTSGAELYFMDYLGNANDASGNESWTLSGHVTSAGGSDVIIGGGHGNEHQTEFDIAVDGTPLILASKTASRSRVSNVATIVTTSAHGVANGDTVTVSGLSGTGYNAEGVVVTVIDSTTFTFSSTGTDEAITADTGGYVISHKIVLGSDNISIHRDSYLTHPSYGGGTASFATASTTYSLDSLAMEVDYSLTTSEQFTANQTTFLSLMTVWSGDRANWGPEYNGLVRWRPLDGGGAVPLTADDNSENFVGTSTAFSAFAETTGNATVIQIKASSLFYDFNNGNADTFIQDRPGGAVEKMYFPFVIAIPEVLPAGYTISGTTRRYDSIFDPGTANPLFAP